jgi:hypothetical protein
MQIIADLQDFYFIKKLHPEYMDGITGSGCRPGKKILRRELLPAE